MSNECVTYQIFYHIMYTYLVDHLVPESKGALGETSWQFLWLVLVSIDLLECPVVVNCILDCLVFVYDFWQMHNIALFRLSK